MISFFYNFIRCNVVSKWTRLNILINCSFNKKTRVISLLVRYHGIAMRPRHTDNAYPSKISILKHNNKKFYQ